MTAKSDTEEKNLRNALDASLQLKAGLIYFYDGCCYKMATGGNVVSNAVVELTDKKYVTVEPGLLPKPAAAHLEIVALTCSLELLQVKRGKSLPTLPMPTQQSMLTNQFG